MSVRNLLSQFKRKVAQNPYLQYISDDQRRGWLDQALQTLSDAKPIENHTATVKLAIGGGSVVLPPDFLFADEQSLLSVEYNFSFEFAQQRGIDLSYYGYSVSRPIADYNTRLRYLGSFPSPRITEESVYGVTRKVISLHIAGGIDQDEILIYTARYYVADARIDVTLKSQPLANDTIVITVRNNDGDQAYTYTAVTGTPAADQFKTGSTIAATAANLAAVIVANMSTTGLIATAEGQVISITGASADVDATIVTDGVRATTESFPAYSNLDSSVAARVYKLMEADQFDYLGTAPAFKLSKEERQIYLQKAVRLRDSALEKFIVLTV